MVTKNVTLSDLPKELEKLTKDINSAFDNAIKDYTVTFVDKLFDRSPVDTGLYRSNHNVSLNRRYMGTFGITDKSTVVGDAASKVNEFTSKKHESIYIQNNVPYAEKLENGWSRQAPSGVYGQTLSAGTFKFQMKD